VHIPHLDGIIPGSAQEQVAMRHIPIQRVNLPGTSIKAVMIQNAKHDLIQVFLLYMLTTIKGCWLHAECAAGVRHHFAFKKLVSKGMMTSRVPLWLHAECAAGVRHHFAFKKLVSQGMMSSCVPLWCALQSF